MERFPTLPQSDLFVVERRFFCDGDIASNTPPSDTDWAVHPLASPCTSLKSAELDMAFLLAAQSEIWMDLDEPRLRTVVEECKVLQADVQPKIIQQMRITKFRRVD